MKNLLLLLLVFLFGCINQEKSQEYEYTVKLISCVNKPEKVIMYRSDEDPVIRAYKVAVPIFHTNYYSYKDSEYLNICDFEVLYKIEIEKL